MGMPDFNRNDNEMKDEPSFSRMDPEGQNQKKGKRMADVMKQLNPLWPEDELDPEAKKRYHRMNFPMKPTPKKPKILPKIGIKPGGVDVNEVDLGMKVDFGGFSGLPDI